MKFVLVFSDPGGSLMATTFEANDKTAAMDGLLDRCVSQIEWAEGVNKTAASIWPHFLIYEDLTFDRIGKGPDPKRKDLGDVAMVLQREMMT